MNNNYIPRLQPLQPLPPPYPPYPLEVKVYETNDFGKGLQLGFILGMIAGVLISIRHAG